MSKIQKIVAFATLVEAAPSVIVSALVQNPARSWPHSDLKGRLRARNKGLKRIAQKLRQNPAHEETLFNVWSGRKIQAPSVPWGIGR